MLKSTEDIFNQRKALFQRALFLACDTIGPPNLLEASKLLRKALNARHENSEAEKLLNADIDRLAKKISNKISCNSVLTPIRYQVAMLVKDDLWKNDPLAFIAMFTNDPVATDNEGVELFEKILANTPNLIQSIKDKKILDRIGECYFNKASEILGNQWLYEKDNNKKESFFKIAMSYLRKVPGSSNRFRDALFDLAFYNYYEYEQKQLAVAGIEATKADWSRAIQSGHEGAKECLTKILQSRLVEEHIENSDPTERINDKYVQAYAVRIKGIIKSIPYEISKCPISPSSSYMKAASTWVASWYYGTAQQQQQACHDQFVRFINTNPLYNKQAPLTNNETIELARQVINLVTTMQQKLSANDHSALIIRLNDITSLLNSISSQTPYELGQSPEPPAAASHSWFGWVPRAIRNIPYLAPVPPKTDYVLLQPSEGHADVRELVANM